MIKWNVVERRQACRAVMLQPHSLDGKIEDACI